MDTQAQNEAKGLFLKYGGNHGLMHHDGVLNEYRKFEIPDSTEAQWATESASELLRNFQATRLVNDEFHRLVSIIRSFDLTQIASDLLDIASAERTHLDSFTRILFCEQLLETLAQFQNDGLLSEENYQSHLQSLLSIAPSASAEPHSIASYYRTLPFLPDALSQDSLNRRILSIHEKLRH